MAGARVPLDLSGRQLTCMQDSEELKNLTGVVKLLLNNNRFQSIGPFNRLECEQLAWLEITHNELPAIDNVHVLVNLVDLYLQNNKLEKIENLQELRNLRFLNLGDNRISKIEGIDQLLRLENLYLEHNSIKVIENLDNLTRLKVLDIGFNEISKFENLGNLTNLNWLSIEANAIATLEHASKMPSLRKLYWDNNHVQTLDIPTYEDAQTGESIPVFPSLKFLSLKNNHIQHPHEVEKLMAFKKLRELNLEGNAELTQIYETDPIQRAFLSCFLFDVKIKDSVDRSRLRNDDDPLAPNLDEYAEESEDIDDDDGHLDSWKKMRF